MSLIIYRQRVRFNDEFSLRIEATELSNIENGLGLFGSSVIRKKRM